MGRWAWSNRSTVEECLSIDIPWLSRHDYFCGFNGGGIQWKNSLGEVTISIGIQVSLIGDLGGNYLRLQYTQTSHSGEKAALDYKVELVNTSCNYGGVRYWFICPLVVNGKTCSRRVAKLYLPPRGKYFGCRQCYSLTYRSCKEHDKRVDALRRLPPQDLLKLAKAGNGSQALLALKAGTKRLGRL
ncbi:MAG: hypothetical protein HY666_02920 [Chloroflexi bacterium]|nr:hypothetical protein [Chloroflexota bacterium]